MSNQFPSAMLASNDPLSRRKFLAASSSAVGAGLFATLNGCAESTTARPVAVEPKPGEAITPAPTAGVVSASEAPEVSDLKFGIIALTDCSPIVIAHEKGLFKKYGIDSTVSKGASWAAIRDALSNGDIQATHMLIGMPIASTMGLLGSPKKPMVVPWLLNRNGQAITLKAEFKGKVGSDPNALKPFVDEAKAKGTPMTFAMTFPPGTHAMWMRYYLASGGIHPDRTVERASDRRRHRFHVDHDTGNLARSSGESLRLHSRIRGKESEDGQSGAKGSARSERLARQHGQSPRASRHRFGGDLHQLSERNHSRSPARKVRHG